MRDRPGERQITHAPHGHILTNIGAWSHDGAWIVYDVRSDAAGAVFDGQRIERVRADTGEVQVLYEAHRGAHVGVVTCSPIDDRIVFIHGPEQPTPDWEYGPAHRRGVVQSPGNSRNVANLDARDLVPPFTPGALRGGTHLHTFDGAGEWVAFTYEDHVLARRTSFPTRLIQERNIGVSVPIGRPVEVSTGHPRNHSGSHFSVLVTKTVNAPEPGSDEIARACEEGWVGTAGYQRADGHWQRAIAFQGTVVTPQGESISEVFIVDLPNDITRAGKTGPLEGTPTQLPQPPWGCAQRRLTFTAERKHPGLQGPRHWLRSSPDGSRIAFLMRDEAGIVQLWTVSPLGGEPRQLTHHTLDIASAFSWSPDGRAIAHAMDHSICLTDARTGVSRRLAPRVEGGPSPRPEACVISPDGRRVAYVRNVAGWNQLFVAEM
jgi:hypothetical protein